jgi:hypothetical protein
MSVMWINSFYRDFLNKDMMKIKETFLRDFEGINASEKCFFFIIIKITIKLQFIRNSFLVSMFVPQSVNFDQSFS